MFFYNNKTQEHIFELNEKNMAAANKETENYGVEAANSKAALYVECVGCGASLLFSKINEKGLCCACEARKSSVTPIQLSKFSQITGTVDKDTVDNVFKKLQESDEGRLDFVRKLY